MTDETSDPIHDLASAVFDDEATADARARVEASPELRDEMVFYGRLRAGLAEVEVPAGARDAAVAAALTAFDDDIAANTVAARDPEQVAAVTSLDARRRRTMRWLGGAAAAAVAVIAIGAISRSATNDSNSSSAATDVGNQLAESNKQTQESAALDSQASITYGDAAGGAPVNSTAAASAPAPSLPAIEGPAAVSPWFDAPTFDTPEQLAAYVESSDFGSSSNAATVASAAPPPAAETVVPSADSGMLRDASQYVVTCGYDASAPSSLAVYVGQDVVVIRDEPAHQALVIEPTSCRVVTTIALS